MASPSSALVLKFSTDLAGAQKNLTNFAASAAGNLASIAGKAQDAKKALDFLGQNAGLIKVGVVGLGAVAALKVAIDLVGEAAAAAQANLDKLVKIGAGAAKAGVGTSFFQAWTGQAKALNLEVSDMVGMLEKFREASTQSILEGGKSGGADLRTGMAGADRIKQNALAGYLPNSALTSFMGAGSEEARIRVVLGLIQQLENEGHKLEAFDLGKTFFGPTFEVLLRNDLDLISKIRVTRDGLQVAGGERIIPPEEIANAQKLNAEMEAVNNRLANQMRPILEEISAIEQGSLEILIKTKSAFADLVDLATDVSHVLASWTIEPLMRGIQLDLLPFTNLLHSLHDVAFGQGFSYNYGGSSSGAQSAAPAAGFHANYDESGNPKSFTVSDAPAITVRGEKSKPLPSLTPAKAASPAAQTDQVENFVNSLKKQTAAEEAEAKTLGLGNLAKAEAVNLAKAQEAAAIRGTPLKAAEAAQVKKTTDDYEAAKKEIEDYARAQQNAKDTALLFGQTLESALEKLTQPGARLQDVLKGVVQALEQASLKALILGEGPLASLFGTAAPAGATGASSIGGLFGGLLNFGGFHADGGSIGAGKWGIAGERGAEIIAGPATVTPMAQINGALNARRSSSVAVTHAPTYHIGAAQGVTPAQLADVLQRYDRQFDQTIGTRIANWQSRRG
jgi:hypothetical protein